MWLTIRSTGGITVAEFLAVMMLMWAALVYGFFAASTDTSKGAALVWTFAILFRVTGFFAEPIFEDDWYRYLWDGRTFVVEGNPYDRAPAFWFGADISQQFERILDGVNYPEVPTIYGPVCQYVFAAAYLIAPGELWPLKISLIIFDLAVIWCLLRLTTVRNTLLYAWCPLAVHEISINAHPEILGIAPAIASVYLLDRGAARSGLVALAIACAARIHAALLLPFLLPLTRRCWSSRFSVSGGGWPSTRERTLKHELQPTTPLEWRPWWAFPVALGLLYLPFWLQGSLADLAGLSAFLGNWEFNSTVYALLASFAGVPAAKLISALGFALGCALLWWRDKKTGAAVPRGDCIYGLFFLFSAVANPWYMLWLLPFVAIFPSVTGLTACAIVTLSYVHGLNIDSAGLAPYEHPWWVRPAEIAAVITAFAVDLVRRSTSKRNAG